MSADPEKSCPPARSQMSAQPDYHVSASSRVQLETWIIETCVAARNSGEIYAHHLLLMMLRGRSPRPTHSSAAGRIGELKGGLEARDHHREQESECAPNGGAVGSPGLIAGVGLVVTQVTDVGFAGGDSRCVRALITHQAMAAMTTRTTIHVNPGRLRVCGREIGLIRVVASLDGSAVDVGAASSAARAAAARSPALR